MVSISAHCLAASKATAQTFLPGDDGQLHPTTLNTPVHTTAMALLLQLLAPTAMAGALQLRWLATGAPTGHVTWTHTG